MSLLDHLRNKLVAGVFAAVPIVVVAYAAYWIEANTRAVAAQVGFTSGRALPGDPKNICVFLPNIPNPISGRLVIVPRNVCSPLKLSVEEAFKFQLSSGNYLPPALVGFPSAQKKLEE